MPSVKVSHLNHFKCHLKRPYTEDLCSRSRSKPSYADDGRATCTFALPKTCSKEQQSLFDFTILISLLS